MKHPKAITNPFPGVIGTFMGRDALRLAVLTLDLAPSDVVLLPAYLCVEVLKPFLMGATVEFYDICPDGSIDPQAFERELSRHRPKAVLFINYFGFLQPHRAAIKELCKCRGVRLIEDCAHSLLTEGSGETGDWVIHSFRKILPLPDGGGLKLNTTSPGFHPRFWPRVLTNILSVLITLKSILKVRSNAFSRSGLISSAKEVLPRLDASNEAPRLLPMSSFALSGMRRLEFSEIVAKRRADFQFWLEWFAKIDGIIPLFDSLPSGVCPLGFPVLVRDRTRWRTRLEQVGLLIRIHWHLPTSVGREFVNSHRLADESLTLPLYPEFSRKQREQVTALKKSVSNSVLLNV